MKGRESQTCRELMEKRARQTARKNRACLSLGKFQSDPRRLSSKMYARLAWKGRAQRLFWPRTWVFMRRIDFIAFDGNHERSVGTISPRLCEAGSFSFIVEFRSPRSAILSLSPLSPFLRKAGEEEGERGIVKTIVIHGAKGRRYLVRD